jgi:hypothetical protein
VTPAECRERILQLEAEAQARIDVLSTVPARARPSAGESGAIADAVAAMAKRQQNAQAIAAIEADVAAKTEAVELEFYSQEA